jgi:predicted permease
VNIGLRDLQYTIRALRRSAAFATTAVLSIAVGVGANVAAFSLLNALLLRELPVIEPRRLVSLSTVDDSGFEHGMSFPAFRDLEARQRVFSSFVGWAGAGQRNFDTDRGLVRAEILAVTSNFYAALGVTPAAGRLSLPADGESPPPLVAVLGYGFWQRVFGGDPSVLGRPVRLEATIFTVIGVAPPGFKGLGVITEPDLTIPLTSIPLAFDARGLLENRGAPWVNAIGRLKGGVSLEQARTSLQVQWSNVRAATMPPEYSLMQQRRFLATHVAVASAAHGIEPYLRAQFTRPLLVVLGISALMLFIASVNLTSLMLARSATRIGEMSLRVALGAKTWHLARLAFLEGSVLAGAGTSAGFVFGYWISRALQQIMLEGYAGFTELDARPDWRVYAFVALLVTLIGALLSTAPVWLVTRRDIGPSSLQHSRTVTRTGRLGKALVVTQMALSLVLLIDSGLLLRTLTRLQAVDPGYSRHGVMVERLAARPGGYAAITPDAYYPELIRRVSVLPGVRAASVAKFAPANGGDRLESVFRGSGDDELLGVSAAIAQVSPGFFRTLAIRVFAGRDFTWQDSSQAPRVAVVSASLAKRLFPSTGAIGRHVRVGSGQGRPLVEVVGVAGDARLNDTKSLNTLALYVPTLQGESPNWNDLLVRTDDAAALDALALRREVQSLGREDVVEVRSLDSAYARTMLRERVTAMLAAFFGGFTLLLAAVGLFGLISYSVVQRRREVGVRMALGATPTLVVRTILRETLVIVLAGIAIGVPVALVSSNLLSGLLVDIAPRDPMTVLVSGATLVVVGQSAAYIPANRAARTPPSDALRS